MIEIDQISTSFPEVAETPDRTNKSTFSTLMKAAFQNMGDFLGSMRLFKTEFNTSIEQINSITAGLSQQDPIAAYNTDTTYQFPTTVAGSNGNSYRCLSLTGITGINPTTDNGTNWRNLSASPIDDSANNNDNTQTCWSAHKTYNQFITRDTAIYDELADQLATRDTAISGKGAINGQAWTGTQNFTGATVTVANKSSGDNTAAPANTAFVQQEIKAQSSACSFTIYDPEVNDEVYIRFPFAATITRVDAGVAAATSCTFQLSEASSYGSSGTTVMTSPLAADSDGANTTSFSNASIASGAWLRCYVTSVSGTPGMLDVSVTFNRA